MSHQGKRLIERLHQGETCLGLWANLGSATSIEAMGFLGADWILIDGEHGAASQDTIVPLLRALSASETPAIVRVPKADPVLVQRLADAGASGVLLPKIKTVEEVSGCIAASRYPPAGDRGIGPWRASSYFTRFPEYYKEANESFVVAAQVETLEAMEVLDDLAALEGLDSLFVGPADLSAAYGHFPDTSHAEVEAAYTRIIEACNKNSISPGFYCNSGKEAAHRIAQGFRMVSVGTEIGAIVQHNSRQLRRAQETP